MQKIAFIHLYNDFSGSPAVLKNVINGFLKQNYEVTLITNKSIGKLSYIKQINYNKFNYKFVDSTIAKLFNFTLAQVHIFLKVLFLPKETKIYINTILPFGAAIAGFISKKQITYHIHETSIKPKIFKEFLFGIANFSAKNIIYVSKFIATQERLAKPKFKVIYNALSNKQKSKLNIVEPKFKQHPNILMLCSLKDYKGIPEFIALAKQLINYNFTLVCNADEVEVKSYLRTKNIPLNLSVFSKTDNVTMFYSFASVVVNLSKTQRWIETFGLTLLEAMQAGIPVIGQPIGGNAEILENGKYGYCLDSNDLEAIENCLVNLLENENEYLKMSNLAKQRASFFSIEKQQKQILNFVNATAKIHNITKTVKAETA